MKKFEYNFKALGTNCIITIISKDDKGLNKIINTCYENLKAYEGEFSRFKETSSLSKLNKQKSLEVSEDFLSLIYYSREIYKLTNGYFNPLIDLRKIGYSHNFEDNNFEEIDVRENLSFDDVKNYGNLLEIGKNMNLDFGSIAKGYFAEKVSKYLHALGYLNNFVNLGGDIYASGLNLEGKKWNIGITNPFGGNELSKVLEVSDGSISTSGTYLRNWEIKGEKKHHIRTPFSKKQETELVSATILHEKGHMTDALATSMIAMGKNKALEFCEKNNIKYLFILNTGEILSNI